MSPSMTRRNVFVPARTIDSTFAGHGPACVHSARTAQRHGGLPAVAQPSMVRPVMPKNRARNEGLSRWTRTNTEELPLTLMSPGYAPPESVGGVAIQTV